MYTSHILLGKRKATWSGYSQVAYETIKQIYYAPNHLGLPINIITWK